jgi:hypothetical protein
MRRLPTRQRVRVWPGGPTGPQNKPIRITQDKLTGLSLVGRPDDEFGAVVDAGHLDDDQFGDMVVAMPGKNRRRGRVLIIPGGRSGYARGENRSQSITPASIGVDNAGRGAEFGATLALIRSSAKRRFDLAIVMQGLVRQAAKGGDTLEEAVVVVPDVGSLLDGDSANADKLPGLDDIDVGTKARIRLGRPPEG